MLPSFADFRLALRRWKGRPGLALSAIATLALGLAATTTVFSLLDVVVLRGLPWPEPDRLYDVYVARPHWKQDPVLNSRWTRGGLSWTSFQDISRKATTIDGFGVWRSDSQTLGGSQAELVPVMLVNAGLLPMLGVVPNQGRFFTPLEDEAVSDSVVVSHETWVSRFGQRQDILGQQISLNERPFRIVGVLPPRFRFGAVERPEFLRPLGLTPISQRTEGNHFLQAVVRLSPGVTADAATRDLDPWVRGSEPPERSGTSSDGDWAVRRPINRASAATVGSRNSVAIGIVSPNASSSRATRRAARSEWPPSEKKSSVTPID